MSERTGARCNKKNVQRRRESMNYILKILALSICVVFICLLVVDIINPQYGFFAKVNAGHVGIVDEMGKVRDEALQPGFHVTGYFAKVVPVDARIKKATGTLEAFSEDIQQVILQMSVNYCIKAEKAGTLYKTVGMNYEQNLLNPRLMENTKAVIGDYTAEKLIANREDISVRILEKMKADMEPYGIDVTVVSIENIDFTDAFEAAVEAKQVATQEKQRAKTQQEQQTMEAEQRAARDKIAAEAAAEVKKIEADAEAYSIQAKAEAEARANEQIANSLTQALIDYTQVQQWDGQLPSTYMGSESAIPMFSINPPSADPVPSETDAQESSN